MSNYPRFHSCMRDYTMLIVQCLIVLQFVRCLLIVDFIVHVVCVIKICLIILCLIILGFIVGCVIILCLIITMFHCTMFHCRPTMFAYPRFDCSVLNCTVLDCAVLDLNNVIPYNFIVPSHDTLRHSRVCHFVIFCAKVLLCSYTSYYVPMFSECLH